MTMKKACCCLSLRTSSLLILTFFLITNLWSMLKLSTTVGDPMYREFLKNNGYCFYTDILISLIGSLIFLATILSITSNSTTRSLLNVVVAFLILGVIYNFYMTYQYTSNGVFEKIYYAEIEIQAQQLPTDLQVEFRRNVKEYYSNALGLIYAVEVTYTLIVLYFVFVLRSYLTEVKENNAGNAPAQINVKGGADFYAAFPNNVKFPASQQFDQPPQYSV